MPKFYLTTAIDYSNGEPHLGHALEKIGADCIARYHRLRGDAVHFLMGMDEHSQSVIQAAARAEGSPQQWVDRMAATFADYWRRLHCSNDDWIRTTEPRHARAVAALLERIRERHPADLFEAEYEGLYCAGCEEFKTGAQIVDGHCVEHPTLELIPTKERNHFFRLSAYRDAVLDRIRSGSLTVQPEIRRNEVLRLLEAGLQDISISRQRQPWGIPFPGDPQQTVYVWFDALINYLSATGFPEPGYERLWPADLHVVGKGITRFHCVIWPAMLLAAELPPPRAVWAHGYVQWSGTKMSKTAGTAVTLADTIGNLASRALTMIVNYRGGTVPRDPRNYDTPLEVAGRGALAAYAQAMDANRLQEGAAQLVALASAANRYVEATAPYKIAKQPEKAAELDSVLANLARTVARIAVLAQPFLPATAGTAWATLGSPPPGPLERVRLRDLDTIDLAGRQVHKPPILFPKPRLAPV